jgi:WD40 repeat protein
MTRHTDSLDPVELLNGPSLPVVRLFGDLRFHTDGDLQALAFGGDGSLWSVEDDGVLRHWDPDTGRQLGWTCLSALETLWGFSPDARLLASASDDLSLWDPGAGELLTGLPQPSWVTALAFDRDPTAVATGHDDGTVRLWDTAGRQFVREFHGHQLPVSALAFSPDGGRLASAGEDRLIRLWEVGSGRLLGTLPGHTDRIQAVAWHPDGRRLISAGWDTTARLWDTATCEPIILLNSHADQVTALAFSPDGGLLACADSAHALHVWDVEAAKDLHVLREHGDEVRCLAFSRDGRRLASGGADRVICLWEPRAGRLLAGHGEAAARRTSLVVSPDGMRLASSRGGAGVRAWDVASGQPLPVPAEGGLSPLLAGSPDGRWLAGGGSDTKVFVWDARSGKVHRALEGPAGKATALAFAPDSAMLAAASDADGMVWLWHVPTGEPVLVIPEAADNCSVEAVVFHPHGRLLAAGGIDWLATGGSNGAIGLWDVVQRRPVATFDGGTTALKFHPSGRWLAAASLVESVCVWDVEGERLAFELTGHTEAVTCVAYSPDGRWLASGGDDRTVRLWNAETGEAVAVRGLDTQVKALAFSPDGRYLFTGNGNTTCSQHELRQLVDEA